MSVISLLQNTNKVDMSLIDMYIYTYISINNIFSDYSNNAKFIDFYPSIIVMVRTLLYICIHDYFQTPLK